MSTTIEQNELYIRAENGDLTLLQNPNVAKRLDVDDFGRTPLHILAEEGFDAVLGHPKVASVRDDVGATPLHEIARLGTIDVLSHPEVASVRDEEGKTPLHWLARAGAPYNEGGSEHNYADRDLLAVISHPQFATVKDKSGATPLHILAYTMFDYPSSIEPDDERSLMPLRWLSRVTGRSEKSLEVMVEAVRKHEDYEL